jgi:cell division protein FtsQ
LGAGTPLARVNADDVEARVMGIPAISAVTVSRRWPNMIVISVVERARVATTQGEDGRWATLDAGGYPFEFTKKKPQGLPVIESPDGEARTAAIAVASALPPELLSKIKVVSASESDNVVLKTSAGVTVAWGKPEQNDLKARILVALLAKTKHGWIDLRVPTTPTSAQSSPKPRLPSPTPEATGPDGLPLLQSAGAEEPIAGGEMSVPTPSLSSGASPTSSSSPLLP